MRHFLDLFDLGPGQLLALMDEAARMKGAGRRGPPRQTLAGRVVGLVFEKPSLRTRVSFEAAVAQLGGTSLFLPGTEVGMGWREPLADFARTMNHYIDALVLRVFKHATVQEVAANATFPVINGLSELEHPCQALADVFTMREVFGRLEGRTVAFVGDGNNVARSLAVACGKLGVRFVLASPEGYGFAPDFVCRFRREVPGAELVLTDDPAAAVRGADVVYTDVWASMGQEAEKDERFKRFRPYQVNGALMAAAPAHAVVMHCLPAHRGEEVTGEVIDGERSVVFEQAGNRLHVQKAVLEWVMR